MNIPTLQPKTQVPTTKPKAKRERNPSHSKGSITVTTVTLLEALKRRLQNLKMNGKTGIIKELDVIIDLNKNKKT